MSFTFIPWVRTGLSGSISVKDDDLNAKNRATVTASITVSNTASQVAPQPVGLYGPGDVAAIDNPHVVVVRTDPPDGSTSHEPTRFVLAEINDPAGPWQFTPTAATDNQRLRPWLTLVVVEQQDGVSLTASASPGVSVLEVASPAQPSAELPDPATIWAWAHTQIVGAVTAADVQQILAARDGRAVSRLMCARNLLPARRYLACLVPTFLAGAQAGLGQTPDPVGALTPAWSLTDTKVMLPVYYSWTFTAGESGDFMTLASLLKGQAAPAGVGEQLLDVSSVAAGATSIRVGGALQRPGVAYATPGADVRRRLASSVGASGGTGDLRAPLYGATYTGATVVDADASGWLAELNLDPCARVAAGLGARVVGRQQDELVAGAWDQAGEIASANRLVDRVRLAQRASERVHDRHLNPLPPEVLLQVTAPAHERMRMGAQSMSVRAMLEAGSVPAAAYSFAFTRLISRAPVVRRAVGIAAMPQRGGSQLSGSGAGEQEPSSRAALAWRQSGVSPDRSAGVQSMPALQIALGQSGVASVSADGRFTAELLDRLDPGRTIPARMLARVETPPGVSGPDRFGPAPIAAVPVGGPGGPAPDLLLRALFAPSFPTPMYPALAQTAREQVLPGADLIPSNAVLLLETSRRFVAACMAGMNSELGRELAWRGFPVDRRATFFESFWDFRGQQDSGIDIPPIGSWPGNAGLADVVSGSAAAADLVLVVRAELLRRYPTALIYAIKAQRQATGELAPSDDSVAGNILQPAFSGSVPPDLRFFGFALTEPQVRSGSWPPPQGQADQPGWFFAFQEQPAETRFGIESGQVLDLSATSATSATVAATTLRAAVLVAIHANDLLPPS